MEITENVCRSENGTKTERTDAVSVERKEGSTAFGKFKDANALLKAYESLQAEFTRRSQRLKEMERAAENREEKSARRVEKLKRGAQERKRREREFDSFVETLENTASFGSEKPAEFEKGEGQVCDESERPDAIEYGEPSLPSAEKTDENSAFKEEKTAETLATAALDGDGESENSENASEKSEAGEFVENKKENVPRGGTALGDVFDDAETLYRLANENEEVRLRIVGEYLRSVGKPNAPIMKGGAGTLAAPVKKATSIGEAGRMALRFFKNDGQA